MSLRFDRFCLNYTFSSFSRYLLKLNWEKANDLNEYYNVWHSPIVDGKQEELVVPITREVFRLERNLDTIIKILMSFYNKKEYQILDDFENSVKDQVKFRVKSEMTEDGYIPLVEGVQLLENTKEMLIASFLSVNNKRKNFTGPHPETVDEVINNIKMGQTEEGSFIINIYLPNDYYEDGQPSLLEEESDSFTRKALTIMEQASTELISKAETYEEQNNDLSVFDDSYLLGVSSNLCSAISEISSNGKNDVEIEIILNNKIDDKEDVRRIEIRKELIPIIDTVREYYKQDLTTEDYVLIGHVTKLHQEVDESEGDITLTCLIDGKLKKVKLELNETFYTIAQEAHRNKSYLRCVGTLKISGRVTTLTNIEDVLIISDDEIE
ncbi:hypothetical protein [Methanosphaera sp.]|uniref:hypothetical protein n=1 Tax=Methanosphaera sp. TaxID=2666342 RepID=UPI0025E3C586|nr:hypothetical protein [Methanosphaera sp.]